MNIFAIENNTDGSIDWVASAQSQDNYRVVKMTLETAQLMCSALNILSGDKQITPYKTAHRNHPCTIWARESYYNFIALGLHGIALGNEYNRRFGKQHKSLKVINQCLELCQSIEFPQIKGTKLPLCMPDEFKSNDIVHSYRTFYASKPRMRYPKSKIPQWFKSLRTTPFEIIGE